MSDFVLPGISEFQCWTEIHKFSEIEIKPNTLVLCDIDNTLIHHPCINNNWCTLIQTFFYTESRNRFGVYDRNLSFEAARRYCDGILNTVPIQHTDEEGFRSILDKAAGFAFITARHEAAKEFTHENLRSVNIDPETVPIYFCGDVAKGEYIKQHIDIRVELDTS